MKKLGGVVRPIFIAVASFILVQSTAATARAQEPSVPTTTGPRLDFPAGLATDNRTVYVASSRNNTVTAIDVASHAIRLVAGETFKEGNNDGSATGAHFNSPEGIALIGNSLYVVDTNNSDIRKIDLGAQQVTTVAGQANISGTEDGPATEAHFNLPTALATDGHDLFVCDSSNSTVRKISLSERKVTTIGGQAQTSGKDDGPIAKSSFSNPRGVATDGKVVFVADTGNDKIRKIDLGSSTVSTLAGTGEEGNTDGPPDKATFNNPGAMCLNGGNLYVMDSDNHAVRKIDTATGTVSTSTLVNGHIGSGCTLTSDGAMLYYADTTENSVQVMQTSNGQFNPLWPQ